MTIVYHDEVVQGSEIWHSLRCGMITASQMHLLLTATLKPALNEKERAFISELTAQRLTNYVEPQYISDDMLRGQTDEIEATALYGKTYAALETVGFITNDKWGFTIGYSPDAKLAGKQAGIENKSRRQRFQIETICALEMPVDYVIQVQSGLLVSEWEWIDFNSYSGGLPMVTLRIYPDDKVQEAIINVAGDAENRISEKMRRYQEVMQTVGTRLIPTERKIIEEMYA